MINETTGEMTKVEKEGKNFMMQGIIILRLVDTETGYSEEYTVPAAQTGNDLMQIKGNCETYAMRQ